MGGTSRNEIMNPIATSAPHARSSHPIQRQVFQFPFPSGHDAQSPQTIKQGL